ncbi:MAG TPA: tetratricopeptide repeat protein, partial [Planctomycetota bacterium]|nr:tetratricopeptide repeat protein [Planctomycetota bacterium]
MSGGEALERGRREAQAGDFARARASFEAAIAAAREAGGDAGERGELEARVELGTVRYLAGEREAARGDFERALAIARARDDRATEARCLGNLGLIYRDAGEEEAELHALQQALNAAHASR